MSHTILIADDSLFIREALCNVFEREEDFDVCGEAKTERKQSRRLGNCTPT
jgi:DNA-binding NarL/FixJ family response regulator